MYLPLNRPKGKRAFDVLIPLGSPYVNQGLKGFGLWITTILNRDNPHYKFGSNDILEQPPNFGKAGVSLEGHAGP